MSTYITEADYATRIDADILTSVSDDDPAILDDCENMALEFMRGYLHARYDVAAIFGETGADRNPLLVKYAVDIALYYMYERVAPESIPENRQSAYDAAEKWLTRVQRCEINPPDLPRVTDGTKDYISHGSNPRRRNHIE